MVAAVDACLREQGEGNTPTGSDRHIATTPGSGEFPVLGTKK